MFRKGTKICREKLEKTNLKITSFFSCLGKVIESEHNVQDKYLAPSSDVSDGKTSSNFISLVHTLLCTLSKSCKNCVCKHMFVYNGVFQLTTTDI